MNLEQIEADLNSKDFQERLRAVTALRSFDSSVAVPLLCSRLNDPEFVVRSLAAMGLGQKRTSESFTALRELVEIDPDPSVRAEAVYSLILFGAKAVPDLVMVFRQDQHWLVRRNIIAGFIELERSEERSEERSVELFNLCALALRDPDLAVGEIGIEGLATFSNTSLRTAALDKLLPLVKAEHWQTRVAVSKALRGFDNHQAREALIQLSQDQDYRVIGAVLEGLV
jgi:HEAT repeat protein